MKIISVAPLILVGGGSREFEGMKFPHGFKIACNFAEQPALENFEKIWNLEKWGYYDPPSRSLVKSKITPPNPLVLKDFFLDQKKKKRNWSKTTVCV